jgi:predicted DNA-binding transcriptional regulator AlpA
MSASTEKAPTKGQPADNPASPLDFYELPPHAVVRVPVVASVCGVSVPTVWRWARENSRFPRGRKLGPRTTMWNVGEIRAFLANPTGAV